MAWFLLSSILFVILEYGTAHHATWFYPAMFIINYHTRGWSRSKRTFCTRGPQVFKPLWLEHGTPSRGRTKSQPSRRLEDWKKWNRWLKCLRRWTSIGKPGSREDSKHICKLTTLPENCQRNVEDSRGCRKQHRLCRLSNNADVNANANATWHGRSDLEAYLYLYPSWSTHQAEALWTRE